MKVLVAGAGGFIGGHLVRELLADGVQVRAVDIKPLRDWYQAHDSAENRVLDLADRVNCLNAVEGIDEIINLAADMGGMGFIETHKAECMLSVLINTHLLMAARSHGVKKYLFASSACVYNGSKQRDPRVTALREEDAHPADPEDGYGWEKLFSERMCRHFYEDYELSTYAPRFHNVYGTFGTFEGGREKAPAAIARKVAIAKLSGVHEIEIWGDGHQTRSFMYVDDCIYGIRNLMKTEFHDPVNLGSSELVSINDLVSVTETIAGLTLKRSYDPAAPQGVRGRNSDNSLLRKVLNWEPSTMLVDGMERTYSWVYDQVKDRY